MPLRSTRTLPGLMSRWTRPAVSCGVLQTGGRLAHVMRGPERVHRPGPLDDLLEAGPVHVLHDEEVQFLVLIDVVGADDVGMVEGGDGLRFAVEAFERGGVLGLGGRQHLDGHAAAHQLVFAEINAAHAAGAEALQHLILADVETAPLAQEELFGLKGGEQAVAHHQPGQFAGVGWQRTGLRAACPRKRSVVFPRRRRSSGPGRPVHQEMLATASAYLC